MRYFIFSVLTGAIFVQDIQAQPAAAGVAVEVAAAPSFSLENFQAKLEALKSPEAKGQLIAEAFEQRDRGFGDCNVKMKMILRNQRGETSERDMEFRTLEVKDVPDRSDKSFVIFHTPRDVNGTALLSHAHIETPDDQWLYLPAIKRTKRISSKNKSGPFMGSEFAYEDITSNEIRKFSWKLLGEETCAGLQCYKIERKPLYENSGYTKQVVWIDMDHFRLQKIDYYDRKDTRVKTQTMKNYRLYEGKHWRADEWFVENHQTGKSTTLIFEGYQFNNGFSDIDFEKARLKSGR